MAGKDREGRAANDEKGIGERSSANYSWIHC